jgi:hypothetical protein
MQHLTLNEIGRTAPSVFQTQPKGHLSDKYAFIPTTTVINILEKQHWFPTYASESRTRLEGNKGYQKHVLRFRHESFIGQKDLVPELVLANSHNGSSSFQLMTGVFRFVCGNGLIVADSNFETIKIRHMGFNQTDVIDASYKIIENVPQIMGKVEEFKSIDLTEEDRSIYVDCAASLRWNDQEAYEKSTALKKIRRNEDKSTDLFTTYNVIQENMIKGGTRDSSWKKTRAVNSLSENVRLNKALWS